MAWVRLDDKRAVNRKLRAAGFAARGLDEAAICWSAHQESDGFISDADLAGLAALHGCKKPGPLVEALVVNCRWIRHDDLDGYEIVGYLKYNPSHAELEGRRKANREAGQKGGRAKRSA